MPSSSPIVAAAKAELRRRLRAQRDALPLRARQLRAQALADAVALSEIYREATSLALYRATGSEIDLGPLQAAAQQSGKRIALPRIADPSSGRMEFAWVVEGQDLTAGPWGTEQPPPSAQTAALAQIALMVVPALAVDEQGYRLGQGGGYYDRLLAHAPASLCVLAAVYDFQQVMELPHAEHDRRVHGVASDRGLRYATLDPYR